MWGLVLGGGGGFLRVGVSDLKGINSLFCDLDKKFQWCVARRGL